MEMLKEDGGMEKGGDGGLHVAFCFVSHHHVFFFQCTLALACRSLSTPSSLCGWITQGKKKDY